VRHRFRIDIYHHMDAWRFVVYDLQDHGPDLIYAQGVTGSADDALHEASHYCLVAA
jgi:hypothetical protein